MPKKGNAAKASVEAKEAGGRALEEAAPLLEEEEEEDSKPRGKRPKSERLSTLLGKGFRPVSVVEVLAVQGGFLKQPEIVPVLSLDRGGEVARFISVNRDADWLCRAVSGEGRAQHPLKRVQLLEDLREQLRIVTGRAPESAVAVAEAVDPGAALEFSDDEAEPAPPGAKDGKPKKHSWSSVATVVAVAMPERCAEAYPEEAESRVRQVRLYCQPGRKYKNLWLHSDDLPWALEYMQAQHSLQGVPRIKRARAAPVGEDAVVSSSVEERFTSPSKISWVFQTSSWEATALSPVGPRKRVLKPESLQLWEAQLVDEQVQLLEALERSRLKNLAYGVLEKWSEAMSQGREWSPQAVRDAAVAR